MNGQKIKMLNFYLILQIFTTFGINRSDFIERIVDNRVKTRGIKIGNIRVDDKTSKDINNELTIEKVVKFMTEEATFKPHPVFAKICAVYRIRFAFEKRDDGVFLKFHPTVQL